MRPGMLHGTVVLAAVDGEAPAFPTLAEEGLVQVTLVAPGEHAWAGRPLVAVAHAVPERARAAAENLAETLRSADACAEDVATQGAEGVPPSATPPPEVSRPVAGVGPGVAPASAHTPVARPAYTRTLAVVRRQDGDVDAAFARLPHVAAVALRSGPSVAAQLEPDAALAVPRADGGLLVYSPGHDARAEAEALTAQLGHPVHVLLVPSGGSYGAREAPGLEEAAGRLALASGRPVRVTVQHLDAMRMAPRRAATDVMARAGVDAEGRLAALDLEVVLDGGSEAHGADRLLVELVEGLGYTPPSVRVVARVVASEGPRTAPIRGAGLGVALAAVEQAIDRACADAGVDAVTTRRGALPEDGRRALEALLDGGEALAEVGAAPVADASGARGISVVRGTRPGGARVCLRVEADGQVEVQCNVPDLGQGRDFVLVRTLAATTGMPTARFHVAWSESRVVGAGAPPSAPVERAATAAGRALMAHLARADAAAPGDASWIVGEDDGNGDVGWVAAAAELGRDGRVARVRAVGSRAPASTSAEAARAVLGGAHAGVTLALADRADDDLRIRSLGAAKLRATPRLEAQAPPGVPVGDADLGGLACSATAAALVAVVARHEGAPRSSMPLRDSAAAASAGVRAARA